MAEAQQSAQEKWERSTGTINYTSIYISALGHRDVQVCSAIELEELYARLDYLATRLGWTRREGQAKDIDINTLDMTAPRSDGHRFLRSTTYHDGSYSARCLKCGSYAHLSSQGDIIDLW